MEKNQEEITLKNLNDENLSFRGREKRTTLNEWEKLTAPSNRRLNMESLPNPILFLWSIDRITIVGKLKEDIWYRTDNGTILVNFEQLMRLNENNGFLEAVGENSWSLCDRYGENMLLLRCLSFKKVMGALILIRIKLENFFLIV